MAWFDLDAAIADARELDRCREVPPSWGLVEQTSAAWKWIASFTLDQPAGPLMPLGTDHVVAFHDHPRVISLRTGEVVRAFAELPIRGIGLGPIDRGGNHPRTQLALDARRHRFAVANDGVITVVQLALP